MVIEAVYLLYLTGNASDVTSVCLPSMPPIEAWEHLLGCKARLQGSPEIRDGRWHYNNEVTAGVNNINSK